MKYNKFLRGLGFLLIVSFCFIWSYLWLKPIDRLQFVSFFYVFYLSLVILFMGILFVILPKMNVKLKHCISICIIAVLIFSSCAMVCALNKESSYKYDCIGTKKPLKVDEYIPYYDFFTEKRGYEGKYLIERDSIEGSKLIKIKNYYSPVSSYNDLNYCVEYIETDNIFLNYKFNFEKSVFLAMEW